MVEKEGNRILSDGNLRFLRKSENLKFTYSFNWEYSNEQVRRTQGTYILVVIMSGSMILEKNVCLLKW